MDNTFKQAIDLISKKEYASASLIQRNLSLSFPRANRIINHLILLGCLDNEMTKQGYKVNKERLIEVIHKFETSNKIDSELVTDIEIKSLFKSIITSVSEACSNVKSRFETINVPSEDIRKFELVGIELNKLIDMSKYISKQSNKISNDDLENFINIFANALHMLNELEGNK